MKAWVNGLKAFLGRRSRPSKSNPYHFQSRYVPIKGTTRHCYVHPSVEATVWEMNTQDKSYRRPICAECLEEA